MLILNSDKSFD